MTKPTDPPGSTRRAAVAVRRLAPRSGLPYELFDCAVFVAAVVGINYALLDAPATQQTALSFLDRAGPDLLDLRIYGILLALSAVAAVVCSYIDRAVFFGYRLLVASCGFWCAAFVLGVTFYGGDPRALASALVYGWVARRLLITARRGY